MKQEAPAFDRFAHWSKGAAWAALAAIILILAAAAWTVPGASRSSLVASASGSAATEPARDDDLRLYDRIVERVAAGENYYTVAIAEQRARNFPVRPAVTVRLPTLAFLTVWLGPNGLLAAAGAAAACRLGGVEQPGRTVLHAAVRRLRCAVHDRRPGQQLLLGADGDAGVVRGLCLPADGAAIVACQRRASEAIARR